MPKNIGGGKRYKKKKNKGPVEPGPLLYADREQEYGIVTKRLGNGLLELVVSKDCEEPRRALGKIRGILRKRKVPFNVGSVVIVSGRECLSNATVGTGVNEREKVDVLHCYYPDEAHRLFRGNKVPYSFHKYVESATMGTPVKKDVVQNDEDVEIVFDENEEEPAGFDVDIDDL